MTGGVRRVQHRALSVAGKKCGIATHCASKGKTSEDKVFRVDLKGLLYSSLSRALAASLSNRNAACASSSFDPHTEKEF